MLTGIFYYSCSNVESKGKSAASRPNLLIIIADQWRGQALEFLNEDAVMTPHLDSFAKHSLVLKNFISNYPVCSPARAMLMSGEYPFTNHVYGNCNSRDAPYDVALSAKTICWSDILKESGYSLGYIGKWHLTSPYSPYIPTYNNRGRVKWNEWTPPNQRHGFDYWYSYGTYDKHLRPMYWSTEAGRMDFHYVDEWEPQHDVDKAIEFLENKNSAYRKEGVPFGLVVSMNPPHTVYTQIPEKYYNLYKNIPVDSFLKDPNIPPAGTPMGDAYRSDIRYYYAAVTGDDDQIGRLLAAVKGMGLDDNTIILFISDHGDCLGKHNEITKNNLYEESLRVPFILYWKGHVIPGIDTNCLMSYPDIYPTLLDMMGFKTKIPGSVQGKSRAQYLLTGKGEYPTLQYFMGNIQAPDSSGGFRGIRTQEYKLAYQRIKQDSVERFLFNLKTDPFEMKNLYGQYPHVTDSLRNILISWLQKTDDPFLSNIKSDK
jgi:arylsulfatase A-like enzyme